MTTPNFRRIPLESITIPEPCTVPWESMQGDHRVRHCQHCDKSVYKLSAMSRADAERLLAERAGRLCVNFCRRSDGTVVTRDFVPRPEVAGRVQGIAVRLALPLMLSVALAACYHSGAVAGGLPAIQDATMGPRPVAVPESVDTLAQPAGSSIVAGGIQPMPPVEVGEIATSGRIARPSK